ncbi:MAG: type II toxin-antitoxin system RelE/ParE family toxin [Deferribacterales bacterium]
MNILWSPNALKRASEIIDYISEDSPENAALWFDKLKEKIENLHVFPSMGRKLPEIDSDNVRELVFDNYGIVYEIKSSTVHILTIRHFRMHSLNEKLTDE